jgi:hypothetical protein
MCSHNKVRSLCRTLARFKHGRLVSEPKVQEFCKFYRKNFFISSTIYFKAQATVITAIPSLILHGWWFTHHRLPSAQHSRLPSKHVHVDYCILKRVHKHLSGNNTYAN